MKIAREIHKFKVYPAKNLGDGMFRYSSQKQLSLDDYMNNLGKRLNANNRWIKLADHLPWDDFAIIYSSSLSENNGRPSKDARLVIGAMIIKHLKKLPDEEVIPEIQENPYLQYFVGLKEFTNEPIFDPSLFVTLRKRLGKGSFEALSETFAQHVKSLNASKPKANKKKSRDDDSGSKPPSHRGQLIIDAVVAPQDIKFPTDVDLLNEARVETEQLIDRLWDPQCGERKPRTYRQNARRDFLNVAKKKRKSKKLLRQARKKQLAYLHRNINTIKTLLLPYKDKGLPFSVKELKHFFVVQEIYRQQKTMHDARSQSIPDRIVSLTQPHVRPIVRGKSGRDTEFGAKLSCSLVDGYAYLDHLSWDAFNESGDLVMQVEQYKERFGFYPESVHADQIYGNRKNRQYLKERGITYAGKALGRPRQMTPEEKRAFKKAMGIRSRIEGKFGEGKRKYDLGLVKTKTQMTSESWIACIFFVMNLAHWLRVDSFLLFLQLQFRRLLIQVNFVKERFAIVYQIQTG